MATLEEGIVARINLSVTSLVSKIYPVEAPQGLSPPYATYSIVSTGRVKNLIGDNGLVGQRIQINVVNTSYSNTKTLLQQVVSAFQNYQGDLSGIDVQQVDIENEFVLKGPITNYFYGVVDFFFHY